MASFLEARAACDHWRGEEGYDAERQADINWHVCKLCVGSDASLSRLKQKYRGHAAIRQRLAMLDAQIESRDRAGTERLCRATRKPAWVT